MGTLIQASPSTCPSSHDRRSRPCVFPQRLFAEALDEPVLQGPTPDEKAKLFRLVLSNYSVDAVSLYPAHRKPFDLIFEKAKHEEWRAQGDDLRTFLNEFVSIL